MSLSCIQKKSHKDMSFERISNYLETHLKEMIKIDEQKTKTIENGIY